MKRYFITGTDTDCGKTHATSQLLDSYPNAVAIKPIASGCAFASSDQNVPDYQALVSSDAQRLTRKNKLSPELINPWRFQAPISPHLAAQQENRSINIKEVADYCMNFSQEGADTLFIEGAGGLMVPLNDNETWVDFLKLTALPVILVVGMRLGCINHALLTEAVLKASKINGAGWIANCIDPQMEALDANIATLTRLLEMPLITHIPFRG